MSKTFQVTIADKDLIIETGEVAGQANGAVTVRYGDTVVLVTACMSPKPREGADFLPLTVDYEERLYAAGKIPGGFIKREGRPSQGAILAMRLTDRPIRPLFPKHLRHEIQVITTVFSADQENDPDILSIIGSSAALSISSIPFDGPASATRIGYIDGHLVVNPTYTQLTKSDLDLVVASTSDAVMMVEAGAREVSESVMMEAIRLGHEVNQDIIRLQQQLVQACGKPKVAVKPEEKPVQLQSKLASVLGSRIPEICSIKERVEREQALAALVEEHRTDLGDEFSDQQIAAALETLVKAEMRRNILEKGIRPSGRRLTEIRAITGRVSVLPRTHGSGLFTRGQTQVLTIATLGSLREEQRLDGLSQEETKRFMHHYNMPPFSNGETKRMGSPGRREIGHGALAERALLPVIPSPQAFPYTVRLVSEVLSSNGSTSMASVCGSTLALMDAGVPIKAPVAGAAMGLIMGSDGKYAVLTDIEGVEDFYGDMDFKVAGTPDGITALQLDTKIRGVPFAVMEEGLQQARDARLFILDKMKETITASRPELSKYAPRMYKMNIDPEKIRNVIGPGGKVIRSIIEVTKTTIDIEDDGSVIIGSPDEEAAQKAIKMIEDLTKEVEVGTVYTGKVTRIMNFGAFVEVLPGKEGLVHVSELAEYPVSNVEDVVKVGDEIQVMVTEIDRMNRINLSRRAVFQKLSGGSAGAAGPGPGSPPPHRAGPPPGARPQRPPFAGAGGGERRGPPPHRDDQGPRSGPPPGRPFERR
ncbi:MAG: polyribonucleotide nucleotidyltransferase [Dehalococcoidia bacterium]|nr:polyribonucleotide nucleotidyltransferase [Dehalococcoidia bacterium]